jgi:hypothetical protein
MPGIISPYSALAKQLLPRSGLAATDHQMSSLVKVITNCIMIGGSSLLTDDRFRQSLVRQVTTAVGAFVRSRDDHLLPAGRKGLG